VAWDAIRQSQVVTFSPPQPPWSYSLTGGGSGYITVTAAQATAVTLGDYFQLYTSGMVLLDPDMFTVTEIGAVAGGNVTISFQPAVTAAAGNVAVSLPQLANPRWLGAIGHVKQLKYSSTCPGGPDAMSCTLQVPPTLRTDALNPGRIVQVYRGAACVWEGILDEPAPSTDGWAITAHGAGTYGTHFAAIYTTWTADNPVNQAITRGLRWANPGITLTALNKNPAFRNGLTDWASYNGASIDWSSAHSRAGSISSHSMRITPSGTISGPFAQAELDPVTPATQYNASAWILDGIAWAAGVQVNIDWYDANQIWISQAAGTPVAITGSATVWQNVTLEATSPNNAAYACISVQVAGNPPDTNLFFVADAYLTVVASSLWLSQIQDSGAETITDHLNLITLGGGLLWQLSPNGGAPPVMQPWVLKVFPIPSAVTRLLIATSPVGRTVTADINVMQLRYQSAPDIAATNTTPAVPAAYATTSVSNAASIRAHGVFEYYQDLSSAGTLTQAAAQAVGNSILSRYQRANFANSFTVGPGQLLTTGGFPVDLGCEQAGQVCQLMVTDGAYGGEVVAAPLTFVVGAADYDDDAQTLTVTPFQSNRHDMSTLISDLYPTSAY